MSSPRRKSPSNPARLKGRELRQQGYSTPDAQEVKARLVGQYDVAIAEMCPQAIPLLERAPRHGACPRCGGKDRARFFRDVNETGGFLCRQCAPESVQSLDTIMHLNGWDFPMTLREVGAWLGMTEDAPAGSWKASTRQAPIIRSREINHEAAKAIQDTWARSVPLSDPVAGVARAYLSLARSLGDLPWGELEALRFHPALGLWKQEGNLRVKVGTYPAIVARIDNPAGGMVSLQRIYLLPDGSGKVTRKKMTSPYQGITRGGAIRLFPVAKQMGITEGLETALAIWVLTGGRISAWAAVDAGGLEAIALPHHVSEVLIFGDRDLPTEGHPRGAGQEAAITLSDRLLAEGRAFKCMLPPLIYGEKADWNDVLTQQGELNHDG